MMINRNICLFPWRYFLSEVKWCQRCFHTKAEATTSREVPFDLFFGAPTTSRNLSQLWEALVVQSKRKGRFTLCGWLLRVLGLHPKVSATVFVALFGSGEMLPSSLIDGWGSMIWSDKFGNMAHVFVWWSLVILLLFGTSIVESIEGLPVTIVYVRVYSSVFAAFQQAHNLYLFKFFLALWCPTH